MSNMIDLVTQATGETLIMVFFSTIFSVMIGLPLGVVLHVTGEESTGGIHPIPTRVQTAVPLWIPVPFPDRSP